MVPQILHVQHSDVDVAGSKKMRVLEIIMQIIDFYWEWSKPWKGFEYRCNLIFSQADEFRVHFHWQG